MNQRAIRLGWVLPCAVPCLIAGILLGRAAAEPYHALWALVCALAALVILRGRMRKAAFCMTVVAFGMLHGYIAYHPKLPEAGMHTVTGAVTEEIRLREDGQMRTVLQDVTVDGQRISGGAYWTCYPRQETIIPDNLIPGSRVTVYARIYAPEGADTPGGFDFREYLLQRNIHVGLYGMDELLVEDVASGLTGWTAWIRHMLTNKLVSLMGEEAGSYAATMLLGSRNMIPEEDREAFQRLGIAHILSISGYHVGVLAGILAMLLSALSMRPGWRILCTALVLSCYAALTGMNPPVVRASILIVLYQIGYWQGRQNEGVHLLLASALLQLLASPVQLTGASFQLSYGAMVGLVLVLPYLQTLWTPENKRLKSIWTAFCVSASAQIGVLLPTMYWFQEVPVLSIVVNMLVMTGASLLLMAQWLMLALLPVPVVSQFVAAVVGWMTTGLLWLIRVAGSAAWLTVRTGQAQLWTILGILVIIIGLAYLWPFRRRFLLIGGVALLVISAFPAPYQDVIYMQFSVGNADAALIRSHHMTLAIDTGEDGRELASYLAQNGLKLDALVVTHLHSDHAGGIQALMEEGIAVKRVYLAEGALEADIDDGMEELLNALLRTGTEMVFLARGDVVTLPDGELTILWPERGKVRAGMDANLHSLTAYLNLRGTSLLLTGDLDGTYERYAAEPVDILKVAHHGSKYSTSAEFLEIVDPQMMLLSCGDEERYLSMQERCGDTALYSTYLDGTITISFEEGSYTVQTMHERSEKNGV